MAHLCNHCCCGNNTMNSAYCVELQVIVSYKIQILMLRNNACMVNYCCPQQFILFVGLPVFEISYIRTILCSYFYVQRTVHRII